MYKITWLTTAASLLTTTFANMKENASYQNFEQLLQSNARSLVLFTSHSTSTLEAFTFDFKSADRGSDTQFITIDCDVESDLCHDYDVNSYPIIRLFENEQSRSETRYRGPKTSRAISGWVRRRELGVVTKVEKKEMDDFKQIDEIVVVAHLPADDKTLLDEFMAVAGQQRHDHVFGYTTDPLIAESEGLAVPSVKVFKNADNDHRILSGGFTSASLSSFLATAIPPAIRIFREKELETFMQRDKLTLYAFVTPLDGPSATAQRRELTSLAKKYEKYVVFAMADAVKHAEMASNFMSRFDSAKDEAATPSIVVHAPLNDNVFMFTPKKKVDAASVESMLTTILKGKAKSGDVFGKDAADSDEKEGHDEL